MESVFKTITLSLVGVTSVACAATKQDNCCVTSPAPCYPDESSCTYCVGPDRVNPPLRPKSCDGDFVVSLEGFYWSSHQDGMEFAIENDVFVPATPTRIQTEELNNLIDAEYKNPDFSWEFGFRVGLGYNSTHDGWDITGYWTWYNGRASSHLEAERDDNHTLLPLWSAIGRSSGAGGVLWATDIESHWKLSLNLIDVELGREFWVSKYMTLRPHVGLRGAWVDQDYEIEHKGGIWSTLTTPTNNAVTLKNDFKGVGVRAGFNSIWNIGKGFALFGDSAVSLVYGRFKVKHDEWNRAALTPFGKTRILETEDHFNASRAMTDLALGLQWSTPFGQKCQYGFTLGLSWEHHMFFDQNQMWRVNNIQDSPSTGLFGQNAYYQRRGDLDTQGWTLNILFEF
ncbi:MAG: hypothetical protein K940chlam2_00752 [Chlamydiae bacterium]|nr:hypothetical protein [Chlamydiota bacterium]